MNMDNMHLVTGYLGSEHITAVDQAAFNAALIGKDQFVLDKGNVLAAQVISNNHIRILDGELMMQGRFVRLDPGSYVDLSIENGTQGMMRNDLVVARYTKDTATGIEGVNLVVIQGTPVASNPADPAWEEGDITDGSATVHDFPIWRIPISGLNVGTPVALFGEPFMDSMRTLPEIRRSVETIHREVDKQLAEQDAEIDEKIAGLNEYTKAEVLTNTTKALYGLGESAVPDDAFLRIITLLDGKAKVGLTSYVGTGTCSNTAPCEITFSFAPDFVMMVGFIDDGWFTSINSSNTGDNNYTAVLELWGETYTQCMFFGTTYVTKNTGYGKKSNNGKTISWYTTERTDVSSEVYNAAGVTYYFLGIKMGG